MPKSRNYFLISVLLMAFVDKVISRNIIHVYNLLFQLVVNIWNYFYEITTLNGIFDKIFRGNIIDNICFQLMVNMQKYLPQKGKGLRK